MGVNRYLLILVLALLIGLPTTFADVVSVARIGYHPSSPNKVIVYTNSQDNTAFVVDGNNNIVKTLTMSKPLDNNGNLATCQGGLSCWVGSVSGLSAGTYKIKYGQGTAPNSITLTQEVSENGAASLTCPSGTITSYTSKYGSNCAASCPVNCGTCPLGAASCSVTYNNANCGDCAYGCVKNGDLAITCTSASSSASLSESFTVGPDVYSSKIPTFLEYFNAQMMQHSAYHVDFFAAQDPPFPFMADGAQFLQTDMAATGLIRLSDAYNSNPSIFQGDKYTINTPNTPDILEYIKAYTEFLRTSQKKYQQNVDANSYAVPKAYGYSFGAFKQTPPSEPWYDVAPWLSYSYETNNQFDSQAFLAYAYSVAPLSDYNSDYAKELLSHTLKMYGFIKTLSLQQEDKAFVGAALFRLYDHTGNNTLLMDAYNLKDQVAINFNNDHTRGNEFYFQEFAKHIPKIQQLGLDPLISGRSAIDILQGKLFFDFKDRGELSVANSGEHVYQYDPNVQFFNSRYQLIESVLGFKTALLSDDSPSFSDVGISQLNWLTGLNAVQTSASGNNLASQSFIAGIGADFLRIHTRMMPADKETIWPWNTGTFTIPGWVSGAYDKASDNDVIYNYDDSMFPIDEPTGKTMVTDYTFTESTNEIVGLAMESTALADRYYNHKSGKQMSILIDQTGLNPQPMFYCRTSDHSCGQTSGLYTDKAVCELNLGIYLPGQTTGTCFATQTSCQAACVAPPTTNNSCFNKIQDIPATCTGGSITMDSTSGCRTLKCTNGGDSMQVLACNKPNDANPSNFEMYKQSQVGGLVSQICIGTTCIKDNGYAKSPSYPICVNISNPPSPNVAPVGFHDISDCTASYGWSCDASDFSSALQVQLYADGPVGSGTLIGSTTANIPAEPGVGAACGGNANHRWSFSMPSSLKDGVNHMIYAYAIDTPAGTKQLLSNSPKTINCAPQANPSPIGFHDISDCTASYGWSCDASDFSSALQVQLYADGPVGFGTLIGSTTANIPAEPGVGAACGGNANHRFSFTTPDSLKTGTSHTIYAYSIDTPGGPSTLLSNSPKTINCAAPLPTNQTCYTKLQDIPATCTGTVTADTFNGCRTIVCSGKQVLACDKGGFFEMYNQGGPNSVQICIGPTCISDGGYAKSANYPICTSGNPVIIPPPPTPPPTPPANQTGNSVTLSIAPWFPQARNYVFICKAQGFVPTSFDWVFGDGHQYLNSPSQDVYHTYFASGTYNVQCTAKNSQVSIVSNLIVNVV